MAIEIFRKRSANDPVQKDMANKNKRYEALVNALYRDIYRYAYWLCHDASVAEDLVQETFLRAWKALDSLKEQQAAKAWLITILRRENARRFERKQLDIVPIDDQPVSDSWSLSTEQETEHHLLRRQIAMLAPEYREPLVLQVLGGFSGDEIAEILDLNKNTVMTRLFRARNQLKDILDNQMQKRGHYNG